MKKHAILLGFVFLLLCGVANANSVALTFENGDQGYDFLKNTRFMPGDYAGQNSMNIYQAPDWSKENNIGKVGDNNFMINFHGIKTLIFNTYNDDDESFVVLGGDQMVTGHPAGVPIPTTLLLFGSGLLGLIGFQRNHQPVDLA
jgi:hypothetical protein